MIRDDKLGLGGTGRLDTAKGLLLSFESSEVAIAYTLEAVALASSDSGEVLTVTGWQGLSSNPAASCTSFTPERMFTRPLIVSTTAESAA